MINKPTIIECPNCSASLDLNNNECLSCGTIINSEQAAKIKIRKNSFADKSLVQWSVLALIAILCLVATLIDDEYFFSNDFSTFVWFGLNPLIMLIYGLLKKTGYKAILIFFISFLSAGLPFFVINIYRLDFMYLDDSVGIASLIGAIASVSFVLGMLIGLIRRKFPNSF